MTMTIGHYLHFRRTTASTMITFHRLQEALVEETRLLLGSTVLFQVVLPNVKRHTCSRVDICSRIALLPAFWRQEKGKMTLRMGQT